ncbi:MAG: outer membrane protein [Elusimicrobiaceae bacterium]
MKKLFTAAVLCALLTPAFAGIDQGIDKGMTHISVLGGFAIPATEYGFSPVDAGYPFGAEDFDYADVGGTYGIQVMHYLTKNIGLGLEFNGTNYSEAEYTLSVGGAKNDIKTSADKYSIFVAGKFNFAPDAKTRVYLPLGVGFAKYKGKIKDDYGVDDSESNTKPALYVGLGLESDINDIFIWGFEARYNHWWMDDSKFADTSYLSDISLMLKVGIKI